jgi:hypothetical protein
MTVREFAPRLSWSKDLCNAFSVVGVVSATQGARSTATLGWNLQRLD